MAKKKSGCGKFVLIAFGLFVGLGMVGTLMSSRDRVMVEKGLKPAPKKQEHKPDPVFEHGFRVGFGMAKTGMVKPNSSQLDALSRQAALQMGREGGLVFKMPWKDGFAAGWSQGD
jgi:hypothetical protein